MPHSYIANRVHVVFSTKSRKDQILECTKLWSYIEGIGNNHHFPIFAVGGIANHVHILLTVPATMPLAKAVQTIKANSSKWARATVPDFVWQEGYAAFSVSASNVDAVADYIRSQPEHHAKHSAFPALPCWATSMPSLRDWGICATMPSRRDWGHYASDARVHRQGLRLDA